jgi:hypothetical protein
MINAVEDGDKAADGQELVSIGYRETLMRTREESGTNGDLAERIMALESPP